MQVARISDWGRRHRASSKKNTSDKGPENPKISKAVEVFNGFNAQFTQIFAQARGSKRTIKTITKSE